MIFGFTINIRRVRYFSMKLIDEYISQAVAALRAGQVILYPTDTIWGLGCDCRNAVAINQIYRIKQRDPSKSMLILVHPDQLQVASGSSAIDQRANHLLRHASRPTTVILPAQWLQGVGDLSLLTAHEGTIGVRIPRHDFCLSLLSRLGAPITSTSANFSGFPSPQGYSDIAADIIHAVGYAVPNHPSCASGQTQGSRIIKLTPQGEVTLRV